MTSQQFTVKFAFQSDGKTFEMSKESMDEYFKQWAKAMALTEAQRDPVLREGQRHGMAEATIVFQDFKITHEIQDSSIMKEGTFVWGDFNRSIERMDQQSIEKSRISEELSYPSYRRAMELKQESVWTALAETSLMREIDLWLNGIQNPRTKESYFTAMNEITRHGFINPSWSVQQFAIISPDLIVDKIKSSVINGIDGNPWSTSTKEARIACFIAFTRYLSRKTEGIVRRAIPCRDGTLTTFAKKSKKVTTPALSRKQLVCFLKELDALNSRDAILAKIAVHGAKRINEVLSLTVEQVNFENRSITFHQSKSRSTEDSTIISFDHGGALEVFDALQSYIGNRSGVVFVTAKGNPIQQNQIDRNFVLSGKRANIPFRMSPHILRATAITLWKQDGYSDSDIMKASGHSSAEMVHRYDKTDLADNVTKKTSLI